MTADDIKREIKYSLEAFASGNFTANGLKFFQTLGYITERQSPLHKPTFKEFADTYIDGKKFDEVKAKASEWKYVDLLFQLSKKEVLKQTSLFDTKKVDSTVIETYLFFAIELSKEQYSRTELSLITREVNRLFPMPAMILFRYGNTLTLSVINRRLHKRDESKDVLEKVTLIKDINIATPHRAHLEILFDLSFDELKTKYQFTNFVELHNAWQKTLDTKELNKKFFNELANWYFWAMDNVSFPDDIEKKKDIRNATNLIRLITRIIFIWFIKEKKLVPANLFRKDFLSKAVKDFSKNKKSDNYYRAILQNLFFGTLNQKTNERGFAESHTGFKKGDQGIRNLYRYPDKFSIEQNEIKKLFKDIPFLNGGLFDCLDKTDDETKKDFFVDGFTRRTDKQAIVPDYLFFGEEREVDLTEYYDPKAKKPIIKSIKGLVDILESYKFTVAENTPIEEEIALDPELLGKVFENLLAYYNPETQFPARKQTGSFYTPREIVNYMVDESLLEYLKQKCSAFPDIDNRLRDLFSYSDNPNSFDEKETKFLIDAINKCKILDPACGSGAFPMGVLHKMVHVLQKLDKDNELWKALQRQKAIEETETAYKSNDKEEREKRLIEINDVFENNASDYGRKLYLIENCIYGIDIQSIAVQIAKLRFFISLIIDQEKKEGKENFGIRSLPNLETKFVAANTLIGLDKPQLKTGNIFLNETFEKIKVLSDDLKEIRHKYFSAKKRSDKLKFQDKDKSIRKKISEQLVKVGHTTTNANKIAEFDPYDQNHFVNWFEPKWMFGLKNNGESKNSVQSIEITLLNKQIEAINKQIDTINFALKLKYENEILKLQLVSTHLQISIIEIEVKTIQKNIDELYGSIDSKVTNIAKDPEDVSYTISALNKRIAAINKKIKEINRELKPVEETATNGVFDIVIGNPPYVNVEEIDETIKKNIKRFKTAYQKYDLYVLFYEKGIDFLKPNGQLNYITSNKFLSQGYGLLLRKEFLKYFIHQVINFNYDIFEAATVRTCIFHLQKSLKSSNEKIKIIDVESLKDSDKFHNLQYNYLTHLTHKLEGNHSKDVNNF